MYFSHQLAGLVIGASHLICLAAGESPPQQRPLQHQFQPGPNVAGGKPSYVQQDASCDALCRQFQDGNTLTSIGTTIEDVVIGGGGGGGINGGANGGHYQIVTGPGIPIGPDGSCGNEASAIWNLWAQAHAHAFPSRITNLGPGNGGTNKICIDASQLVRLTAAATQCYNQVNGLGGSSWSSGSGGSSSWSSTWTTSPMGGPHYGGTTPATGSGDEPPSNQIIDHLNSEPPHLIVDHPDPGTTGGVVGGVASGGSGGFSHDSTGGTNMNTGGSGGGHVNTGSNTGTHSSSGWGTGNVHTTAICFKIKSKRTDRYLTTGGSEYAFARLPGYYSVFRGYPAKGVDNGYTLTEINRNGRSVNYGVKLVSGTGVFRPLGGDKDAVWTFNPAQFGDSCWGVSGKKMQARNDWGGWGPNYREASSGEDCVDVELEEASC